MADYYVDPNLGTDTGAGTVGDPWGHTGNEIQKAMDNITQGANGDTIHIKSTGTVDFSGTDLSFATYGTTTNTKILGFSGYTAAAWDGGQATINLNGASQFIPTTVDGLMFGWLDISGGTSSYQVNADNFVTMYKCKVDGGATTGGLHADASSVVIGNEITNLSGKGLEVSTGTVAYNTVTQNTNSSAINGSVSIFGNLVLVTHTGNASAINCTYGGGIVYNNTVYSSVASTGEGIGATASSVTMVNNYVEGFSGTGGDGFQSTSQLAIFLGNRWYNCTNPTNHTSNSPLIDLDNSATSASGLTAAGSANYIPTNELIAAGFPTGFLNLAGNAMEIDIGAIQKVPAAGGGGGASAIIGS